MFNRIFENVKINPDDILSRLPSGSQVPENDATTLTNSVIGILKPITYENLPKPRQQRKKVSITRSKCSRKVLTKPNLVILAILNIFPFTAHPKKMKHKIIIWKMNYAPLSVLLPNGKTFECVFPVTMQSIKVYD